MYAKGMTTRQISKTPKDIYGNEASKGFISDVQTKSCPCLTCLACAVIYKPRSENSQLSLRPNNYHRRSVFTEIFGPANKLNKEIRIRYGILIISIYRNIKNVGTGDYLRVIRLRKIWAEETFAVLNREHKLNKIQKKGLQKAIEECLLSATALNLKRLVKAV